MEVKEAIIKRRSIRRYKDKPIEKGIMEEILRAGTFAPTASNLQPWVFICITNPKSINTVKILSPGMFAFPKGLIIVCCDHAMTTRKFGKMGESMGLLDCAVAAQNMLLRAFDLGIGTCLIRSFSQIALKEYLKLPEHISPELVISAGYLESLPESPVKKTDVIYWEKYGEENR